MRTLGLETPDALTRITQQNVVQEWWKHAARMQGTSFNWNWLETLISVSLLLKRTLDKTIGKNLSHVTVTLWQILSVHQLADMLDLRPVEIRYPKPRVKTRKRRSANHAYQPFYGHSSQWVGPSMCDLMETEVLASDDEKKHSGISQVTVTPVWTDVCFAIVGLYAVRLFRWGKIRHGDSSGSVCSGIC